MLQGKLEPLLMALETGCVKWGTQSQRPAEPVISEWVFTFSQGKWMGIVLLPGKMHQLGICFRKCAFYSSQSQNFYTFSWKSFLDKHHAQLSDSEAKWQSRNKFPCTHYPSSTWVVTHWHTGGRKEPKCITVHKVTRVEGWTNLTEILETSSEDPIQGKPELLCVSGGEEVQDLPQMLSRQ